MNNHRDYLINRFPALAEEFIIVPDEVYPETFGFDPAAWDAKDDAEAIFISFDWSATPQGGMFWSNIYVQMVRK